MRLVLNILLAFMGIFGLTAQESTNGYFNTTFTRLDDDIDLKFKLNEIHPLDPLTSEEIRQTSAIIKTKYPSEKLLFLGIKLDEPQKEILYPLLVGKNRLLLYSLPRKSFSVLYETGTGDVYEAIVNLKTENIKSFEKMPPGTTPNFVNELTQLWTDIVMRDARVQQKIKEKSVSLDNVVPIIWPNYPDDNPILKGKYTVQFFFYARNSVDDNIYAHPFDFVVGFDVTKTEIISIEELPAHNQFTVRNNNLGVTVPRAPANYDPSLPGFAPGRLRDNVKPLRVIFPDGPSYIVQENMISWQNFKFRIGFNYREGLVLYNINYQDGKKLRPLFYRISISELAASYGDPRPPFQRKTEVCIPISININIVQLKTFDEGWTGLGITTNSLVDGEDCIGATTFFNGTMINPDGSVNEVPNAICLSENDDGILFKHTSETTGKKRIARSRRLTLTQIASVSNYDYIIMWHFYQDASITLEIRATGIVSTNVLAKFEKPFRHGTIVFPQINAQYHQHIFAIRIDPMIDGLKNTISTMDIVPDKGDTGSQYNPYGNGFTVEETILKTMGQARTNTNSTNGRTWKISNAENIHPYCRKPVSYKLIPSNSPQLMMKANSPLRKGMGFASYAMWVTPYKNGQLFAAGFYPEGNNGLQDWVNGNEDVDVENKDVVLWHTFTLAHIPRVEDFPLMPEEHVGFMLKPYNLFLTNPALDVPCC